MSGAPPVDGRDISDLLAPQGPRRQDLDMDVEGAGKLSLGKGDTMSVPADIGPVLRTQGGATLFLVQGDAGEGRA